MTQARFLFEQHRVVAKKWTQAKRKVAILCGT